MDLKIIESELEFTFVRSSGPGGQNVNKVNSKAVLRFNLLKTTSLSEEAKLRALEVLANRLTREGDLLIASDRFRDQAKNREDCLNKLQEILIKALHRDRPRKATRPTRGGVRRRRTEKTKNSEKKRDRRVRE